MPARSDPLGQTDDGMARQEHQQEWNANEQQGDADRVPPCKFASPADATARALRKLGL